MFLTPLCLIVKKAKCTTECRHEVTDLSSAVCYMAKNQISDRYNYKTPKRKKKCRRLLSATKVPALGNSKIELKRSNFVPIKKLKFFSVVEDLLKGR